MKPRRRVNVPGRAERLKIVVDLPWDASACMGTGAYSESMVRALAQAAPALKIILVTPLGAPHRIHLPNVTFASLPETEGLEEGARQVALPAFLHAVEADCLFAPASLLPVVKTCPMVATVHDLTFETHPQYYAPSLVGYLERWFPSTLSAADRIVAISEPVQQDLLFRKRIDPRKVAVIQQPIRETFQEQLSEGDVEQELRALKITAPFLFHVSNLSRHKNMEFGVRILSEFLRRHPDSPLELLFAGGGYGPSSPPDLIAIANSLGIGQRVKYVGKVSDTALKALYQRCETFLFPSLAEGWGLPVVEARALGARVLASIHVPSALPGERMALEVERWVEAMDKPRTQESRDSGPMIEDAGTRLLEVIQEAIRAFRGNGEQVSASKEEREDHVTPLPGGRLKPVIAIRGDWYSPSGLGQAARGVYKALEAEGLAPRATAVPKDTIQKKELWSGDVALQGGSADLWIHQVPPEYYDLELPGKHAGFFFWETDRLPKCVNGCDWPKVLSQLDEIWAPSTFVAEVLKNSGVTAPIYQVSPPVDTKLYGPGPRRPPLVDLPPGFDPTWTVFLYVGTWDPRKRPDLLVRTFTRAFTEADHALLLIKSYVTGDPARDRMILERWKDSAREGDGHVRVLPQVLSSEAMADLFRFATAFVTASRGEGYCLPAVQAMSAGKPVVASGWSSFKDFVSVPVEYRLEPVPPEVTLPGYSSEQRWAAIDEAHLARSLHWIHENRAAALTLGKKARQWVIENAASSVVGKRLGQRIQALCGKKARQLPLEVLR